MTKTTVEVNRNTEGAPSSVKINRDQRKLSVTFDQNKFIIEGKRSLQPSFTDILQMIYPYTLPDVLSIPSPLEVVSLSSGGKIIFYDDMETLLKWTQAAATVAVDNTVAYHGDQSLKITCGAAASNAQAQRRYGLRNKICFQTNFSVDDYSKLRYLAFIFVHDTGSHSIDARIHYDGNNLMWQYLDPAGAYQTIPNSSNPVNYQDGSHVWNFVKIELDYISQKYGNIQINQNIFDLSNYNFRIAGTGGNIATRIGLLVDNDAGNEVNAWFDDVLVTEIS